MGWGRHRQRPASHAHGESRGASWCTRRQLCRCQVYAAVDPLAPVSADKAAGGAASSAVEPALVLDPDRLVYLRVRSLSRSEYSEYS